MFYHAQKIPHKILASGRPSAGFQNEHRSTPPECRKRGTKPGRPDAAIVGFVGLGVPRLRCSSRGRGSISQSDTLAREYRVPFAHISGYNTGDETRKLLSRFVCSQSARVKASSPVLRRSVRGTVVCECREEDALPKALQFLDERLR